MDSSELLNQIAQILYEKKGFNILALDVRGISSLTDYFLVAEGNVERHVCSLAREVRTELAKQSIKPLHEEGLDVGEWVVLDYMDVVIHLFKPGIREIYNLESLWQEGKIVNLDIRAAS